MSARLAMMLNQLSPQEKATLGQMYAKNAKSVSYDAYWSEVYFGGTVNAGVITYAAKTVKAFGYKGGDDLQQAGYPAGNGQATLEHTNLTNPGQTKDNQKLLVYGMSMLIRSDSDAFGALRILPKMTAQVQFGGGRTSFDVGPLEIVPGGGGLSGVGMSRILEPAQNEANFTRVGAVQNGFPDRRNFKEFKSPFVWSTAGDVDSSMTIAITQQSAFTLTLPAARAAGAGPVSAYVQPATGDWGTYVRILVYLHAINLSKRSQNL